MKFSHSQHSKSFQRNREITRFLCFFVGLLLVAAPITVQVNAQADRLDGMTLEEQAAQLFIAHLYGTALNETDRNFLANWQPGGVVLMDSNTGSPEVVTRLTNSYQQTITEAGGLPLFIAVDQEGGPIAALEEGFTAWPTPALMTAAGDPELAGRIGAAVATELLAVGVNMNFAPVADLETNRDNPIIARRSFGSDPALVSMAISGFISGMQSMGVLGTAKHFPGHGATSGDSHTALLTIDLSRERLETVELVPFQAAVDAGVEGVMAAHIWYPALEPEANLPASLSPRILTNLLRQEMGFEGLIITDALDMDAIDTLYSYPEAAVKAIQAGADIILSAHVGPETVAQGIQAVVDAVRSGRISEARLRESVQRVLDAKAQYGILDEWTPLDPASASERIQLDAHVALLDELFRAGVSVAQDRNDLIPLSNDVSISIVYPATRVQVMNECSIYRNDIRWVGVSDSPSTEEIAWATDAAQQVDAVVVFTQNAIDNRQQAALVNALPAEKIIVVALWSPYDLLAFPSIAGYLATYSPARPAVPAVCGVLFGAWPGNEQPALQILTSP